LTSNGPRGRRRALGVKRKNKKSFLIFLKKSVDQAKIFWYLKIMKDEMHHFEPTSEEMCAVDYTSFDHEAYCAYLDQNRLKEDDVDSFYESRFDMGD